MIINQIFRYARQNPDKVAVSINDLHVSYAAFANAIDAVRNFLVRAKLPDDGVFVVISNNLYHGWVLMLALRSLGLTTVAGTAWDAVEDLEIRNIASLVCFDYQTEAIEACKRKRPDHSVIVMSQSLIGASKRGPPPPIAGDVFGDHIVYTSGTTGTYKKLRFSGDQLAYGIEHDTVGPIDGTISEADTYYCHSFGAWTKVGYIMPLICWYRGATVVFDQRPDWADRFFDHAVTKTIVIPPMLKALCEAGSSHRANAPFLASVGGAFVDVELAREAVSILGCSLFIGFAGTEFRVVFASLVESNDDVVWLQRTVDSGVEIVDENDQPTSIGEEGYLRVELATSDPSEYLDDVETTMKHYRNGYFYTGDLAVERKDGRIRILGRVQDVLNIGGQKIAIGPFEDEVRKYLGVENICVFNMQDDSGQDVLVIAIEGDRLPEHSRIETLKSKIPQFPRVSYALVGKFPRGANGMMKIDRRQLFDLLRDGDPNARKASAA